MTWVKEQRPLAPTMADLRKWRRLVKEARRAAAQPTGAGGDLRAAAATARRAVAPNWTALEALCSPLVRLGEAWPTLNDAGRAESAPELLRLADGLSVLVGAEPGAKPAAPPQDDPRPERRPRADIEG